ncbi:histone-lysine N-methyltransferase ASHR2 [Trypanosoma conorhini]|uniref:Histone-lysine N-methyltransferase ASHR2 n=1 Tax=Trypanosoma conorhini TaxID=83891 RepID=A0A3R7LX26_9TRYP|nr:histone-lysine N-methyltransferase ASHR2 [Trypanosoma conorhini]RNE95254.1 histone-lysine N-methyltransferase ASHR2 [Trypanosoma conorhini]
MPSKTTSVEHIDACRGRGLVAEVDFNEGDSILLAPYDIAVLYSPFVRNTCYRCFAPLVEPPKEGEEEAKAKIQAEEGKEEICYECSSCKHLVLCSSCVKDLVAEAWRRPDEGVPAASLGDDERELAMLQTHPLLEAHKLACAWFCTLPDSVQAGDTDYLRFALQYGSRALLGDTRLLLAVDELGINTVQQLTEAHQFCESFAKRIVDTFAPQGFRVDAEHLRDVLLRTKSNSIGYPFNEEETLGWSLQAEICMINHSCVPNAAVVRPKCKAGAGACSMELVARRAIKAGEEVTISYLDVDSYADDVQARRRRLMEDYGFLCCCPKCAPAKTPTTPATAQ